MAFLVSSCLCFFLGFKACGQSRIYGMDPPYLVYFDYISGESDTVIISEGIPFPNLSFGCSIDPYNGNYYFDASPLAQTAPVGCYDLNTLAYSSTLPFNEKNNIEYNCINNSLVFENYSGEFYSYGFKNQDLNLLSQFASINRNNFLVKKEYIMHSLIHIYLSGTQMEGDSMILLMHQMGH